MRPSSRILVTCIIALTATVGCGDDDKKSTANATQVPLACPAGDINDVIAAKPKPRPPLPTRVTLTRLTPNHGGEGARVTIEGPDFGSRNRPGAVFFDNVTAPVYSWAPTQVVAAVPAGLVADVYGVRVSVPNRGFSNSISFAVQPVITTVQPLEAGAGDTLTLTGTGFGPTRQTLIVHCEAVTATDWYPTVITFTVPQLADAVTASIVVRVNDVPSEAASFRYRSGPQPQDTWYPMTTTAGVLEVDATAVWTGSEMLVYAGGGLFPAGALYDPVSDEWRGMSATGAPKYTRVGVWTGTEFIAGAGSFGTARYNPATNHWTAASSVSAPASAGSAVWSGQEMLVWGPRETAGAVPTNTGARYNPQTDVWTSITTEGAPLPRRRHQAVWTGDVMIVWGGMLGNMTQGTNTGGRYDPATNLWTPVTTSGAPAGRIDFTALWTGNEMLIWGGSIFTAPGIVASGGRYDPDDDSWQPTSLTGVPHPRWGHTAVWTGTHMLVWGGYIPLGLEPGAAPAQFGAAGGAYMPTNTGGRYDPAANTWQPTSLTNAPLPSARHVSVWDGIEMIVWGGTGGKNGKIYVP